MTTPFQVEMRGANPAPGSMNTYYKWLAKLVEKDILMDVFDQVSKRTVEYSGRLEYVDEEVAIVIEKDWAYVVLLRDISCLAFPKKYVDFKSAVNIEQL
jgi:hypothetical protein